MRGFPWTFLSALAPSVNKAAYSAIFNRSAVGTRLAPLTGLEQGFLADTVSLLEKIWAIQTYWMEHSPPGFDEFSDPAKWPKYLQDGGLTYTEMRRVYLRRIAILLWSEANEHWPWRASEGTDEELDLLYAWQPDSVPECSGGGTWFSSGLFGATGVFGTGYKSLGSRNGHCVYFRDLEAGIAMENRRFHFGMVWDPDPFAAWRFAWTHVRALIPSAVVTDQQTLFHPYSLWPFATKYLPQASKLRAPTATSEALRRLGWNHPTTAAWQQGMWGKIWHSAGRLPPSGITTDSNHSPYGATTFEEVITSARAGCYQSAGVLCAILRILGVAARVLLASPGKAHAANPDFPVEPNHVLGVTPDFSAHHLLHVPGSRIGLLHADDVCGYLGQHFCGASTAWVTEEFLLLHLATYASYQSAQNPSPQQLAYCWNYFQFRENQARDAIFTMAYAVDWATEIWTPRIASTVWGTSPKIQSSWQNLVTGQPTSWATSVLSFAQKEFCQLNPSGAVLETARRFFGLDLDESAGVAALWSPLGGFKAHEQPRFSWGLSIFPQNWVCQVAYTAAPDIRHFGLAADPSIREALFSIALTMTSYFSEAHEFDHRMRLP